MSAAIHQSVDRREAILQAAVDVLAEVGIVETNLRMIARRAGISSGTLHYYFPSKDELIDAIVLAAVEPLHEYVNEVASGDDHPRNQLRALVEHGFKNFDAKPGLYKVAVLMGDQLRARRPKEFPTATDALVRIMKRGQERRLIRDGDPLIFAILCHGTILRVERARVFGELAPPTVQYADPVVEACWRQVATEYVALGSSIHTAPTERDQ